MKPSLSPGGITSDEKKKQHELAIRFGKSMIRKTYKAKKKKEKRVFIGVVCEDDIVVKSTSNSRKQKKESKIERKTIIDEDCEEYETDDEPALTKNLSNANESIFEENSFLNQTGSSTQESTNQNSGDETYVKIPMNAKYYESIGYLNDDLEFIEISKFSNVKRKVLEIKHAVDGSLNYDESDEDFLTKPYKLFLCINKESRNMVACLIAECITKAKPIIFESRKNSTSDMELYEIFKQTLNTQLSLSLDVQPSPTTTHLSSNHHPSLDMSDMNFHDLTDCSKISSDYTKAVLGVSRIWVSNHMRRQGIASKLLDLAREHFTYGYKVPRKYIATTPFTPLGFIFIVQYLSRGKSERVKSVLIY